MVNVEWSGKAVKDLERLDKQVAQRILKRITWFSNNFNSVIPEPLAGEFKGAFKMRLGVWRIIYTIEEKTVIIHSIGHRREIYKIG